MQSPANVALYGYRDRLFIGIDADETVMPDVERFQQMIVEAFDELRAGSTHPTSPRTDRPRHREGDG